MEQGAAGAKKLGSGDLDLVAALQVAPRAGLSLIAQALDMSVSTVSRRLARLRDEHLLRVVGQISWSVLSNSHPHHVWITTRPGQSQQVAEAVACLAEARFVAMTTGHSDVYCILHPSRRDEAAALLSRRLPATPGLVTTHSELGLRLYASGATWRLPRLSDEQLRLLQPKTAPPLVSTPELRLSADELQVLTILRQNGRATAAEVARALSTSPSTAYRMTQSLLDRGLVRPRVEIEPALLGYPLEAVFSLGVAPGQVADCATALARHPSARYVSTIAGTSSIIHHGLFRDEDHLADFLTQDLAHVAGNSTVEVAVVLRVLTRYWSSRKGVRLEGRSHHDTR